MNPSIIRALSFIPVLVLVVILPWWLSILVLIGLTIYIPFYPEVLFFGFLLDALYSANFVFPYTWLSLATLLLFATMFLKTQIRK